MNTTSGNDNNKSLHYYMDHWKASINPCSIETIPEPIQLSTGQYVWPTMISCYELVTDPTTTATTPTIALAGNSDDYDDVDDVASHEKNENNSSPCTETHIDPNTTTTSQSPECPEQRRTQCRVGELDLHLVVVPDITSCKSTSVPLKFPTTNHYRQTISSSGILDGKWNRIPTSNSSSSWCFASAHSTGTVQIHSLNLQNENNGDNNLLESSNLDDTAYDEQEANKTNSSSLFTMDLLGQSEPPKTKNGTTASPLCLSVAWNSPASYKHDRPTPNNMDRIVSTYSNGIVAIHDVIYSYNENMDAIHENSNNDNVICDKVHMVEYESWIAHSLYSGGGTNSPAAEVWTACFVNLHRSGDDNSSDGVVVLTGGDEGYCKIWDVRAPTSRPIQTIQNQNDMGITCLSPHPRYNTIVAIGSYDETIALYDLRYISSHKTPPMLCQTQKPLGGGIWRMKWHPYTNHRLLVAAMHGGCYVYNFRDLSSYWDVVSNESNGVCNDNINASDDYILKESITRTTRAAPVPTAICKKKFSEHESMVYGADWLVCPHPTLNGHFEAAMSCSFYDKSVYLWDTIHLK